MGFKIPNRYYFVDGWIMPRANITAPGPWNKRDCGTDILMTYVRLRGRFADMYNECRHVCWLLFEYVTSYDTGPGHGIGIHTIQFDVE